MEKVTSGIIYVLEDTAYPEYIRLHYSSELKKKMKYMKENRPLNTLKIIYQSDRIANIKDVYGQLALKLSENNNYKFQSGIKMSWHLISNKPIIEQVIADWLEDLK